MPHLIDKETGLCSVCKRLEIAAIREGKKFKRQNYDVRKLAIDNLTDKDDPNYKQIIDRHYVKYKDSFAQKSAKNKHQNTTKASRPRQTFTRKISFDKNLAYEELFYDDEDDDSKNYEDVSSRLELDRSKSKNSYREVLRKVNLAQVSRINNNTSNSNPYLSYGRKSKNSDYFLPIPNYENSSSYYTVVNSPERPKYQNPVYVYQDQLPDIYQNQTQQIVYVNTPGDQEYVYEDEVVEYESPRSVVFQSFPPIYRN